MRIGVISDVHNNMRSLCEAVEYFNEAKIELLIMCGDWDMPFAMRTMAKVNCPVKSVLGNGDPDIQKFQYQLLTIPMLKDFDLDISHRFLDLDIDGKRIAVFHGDDDNLNKLLLNSDIFDVVCMGHNHTANISTVGKTLIINPGSLVGYFAESGNQPITVALYDTTSHQAQIIDLEKI